MRAAALVFLGLFLALPPASAGDDLEALRARLDVQQEQIERLALIVAHQSRAMAMCHLMTTSLFEFLLVEKIGDSHALLAKCNAAMDELARAALEQIRR